MTRPTPMTQEAWIRDVERRLKAVENPKSLRIGSIVLSAQDGALVVSDGTGQQFAVNDAGAVALPTPADIGAVSTADVALSVDPPPDGTPLSLITQWLTGKWGGIGTAQVTGDNAQYSADTANAAAARIEAQLAAGSSGMFYNDSFNRAAAADLGADYTRTGSLFGNVYGTDGSGNAAATTITGATRVEFRDILTAAGAQFTTDKQLASMVIDQPPILGQGTANNSQSTLILRSDATGANCCEAQIEGNRAAIGYRLAGTFTQLGSWAAQTEGPGDKWDFWAGTGTTGDLPYELVLLHNNLTVLDETDFGHNMHIGGGYRYGGVGTVFGVTQFFYFTTTAAGPTLQAVNFADRT